MAIPIEDITGLVLAGGRGSRMGGVDKGLQNFRGLPLALHTLMRLQMQVGVSLINANRNLAAYESFGAPVWPDANNDYAGPLAGFLTGLEHCETPWLLTVPCDTPLFPLDLAQRLAAAADAEGADIAMAAILAGIAYGIENKVDPGAAAETGDFKRPADPRIPFKFASAIEYMSKAKILPKYIEKECLDLYVDARRAELEKFYDAISPREYDWYL